MRASWLVTMAGVWLAACSSSKPRIDASPVGPTVSIRVDGAIVATVRAPDLAGRVALASLLPEHDRGGWRAVRATGGARRLQLDPFEPYADLDVVLEAGDGVVTIAVYRPVPPGAPTHVAAELARPRLSLAGVEAIEVIRAPPTTPASDGPVFAPFSVTIGAASRTIAPADVTTMPTASPPAGAKHEKQVGWRLVDVLAVVARGPYASVTIVGDVTVTLDAARLDAELAILRPNRKGRMVLDVFRASERVDHVRDVAKITATLR